MKKSVVVEFRWGNNSKDIEVPLNITCDELIHALNYGIGLLDGSILALIDN